MIKPCPICGGEIVTVEECRSCTVMMTESRLADRNDEFYQWQKVTQQREALRSELVAMKARVAELEEQLLRSATVCPKDGCMLWRGHAEKHATQKTVSVALASAARKR